ncbi:Apoptosis-stimulating of p53 protein 1 [Amphibalanus amphitrite]|uniref:Apoptosis-stimulating of p53 protein 1 n=1 Tax=Amphibalanus amphitrite TaxID=1232801 RepID=A0A6A4X335_AMPAM|nr:Apoptosis-stimulating of p53 protein 1 [Amphibalanus amphitrite]
MKLPDGVELTLSELREMAGRQQQQIDDHQQQLVAKEQRLKYLKQQESRHQAMNSETERLRRLRERVEAQELKLRKLRALRGQSEQQRVNNNALSVDLENIRALFNEKEKELSLAVARVEEMTRQLEEVRRGRELRQGPQGDTHRELEKLRTGTHGESNGEGYRNKLNEQQHSQLASQTETLGQRRDEMARIDQRIAELQQRLHRKRVHNQQLASQLHAASAAKRQVRQTSAKTLPAPAPLRTKDDMGSEPADFGLNKSDPKYQTLPYNTKFHMKEAGVPDRQEEPEPAAAPPPGPRPAGPRAPPLGGTLSQGGPLPQTILPQPYGQRPPTQPPPARASGLPRPVAPSVSANTSSSARLQGGAAPPLPNNLHADPAEVNGERPLLPPKPASGPPPSKPTASRLNGEAVPEAPPPTGLTGDVSQVSVRGTQAKGPPHPYR